MFREMRRKKQALSTEESLAILNQGSSGVLAVTGDQGYPYAVPLSYVYDNNKIFFHCALSGHKLDAIAASNKVSFCVVGQDRVMPQEYTTYFRSVIIFGRARILEDPIEKRTALEILAAKYSPEQKTGRLREIDRLLERTCTVEIVIEHITGKEAAELVNIKSS